MGNPASPRRREEGGGSGMQGRGVGRGLAEPHRVGGSGREWATVGESGEQWERVGHSGTQWDTAVGHSGPQWERPKVRELKFSSEVLGLDQYLPPS